MSAESVRDRRIAATSARLTLITRELAVERGLSGFTIDEVCELADVSRRTFFNYFASKDDALLGISARRDETPLIEEFLAGGDPDDPEISPTLFDDFAKLTTDRWAQRDMDVAAARALHAVVEREPHLLARLLERVFQEERDDIRLVEAREGLPEGDLRASAVVQLVGTIARWSGSAFFGGDGDIPVDDLFAERLAAMREIFTLSTERTT
jgi:AcrR family transcriptional regulator